MASTGVDLLWERWAAAWSSHDMDQVLPLYTDNSVHEDVTIGAVKHGKEEIRAFGHDFISGFPDFKIEMTSGFVAGDFGAGEWIMTGTHAGDRPGRPASGKAISVRGASIAELRDGKIRRVSDYWDMATLLRQTGQMPEAAESSREGRRRTRERPAGLGSVETSDEPFHGGDEVLAPHRGWAGAV
jgi:steroid delta-isomerase-like uncharacterized protein